MLRLLPKNKIHLWVGLSLILVSVAAFFYINDEIRYFAGFHYSLRSDYRYAFPPRFAVPATLDRDGLQWPARARPGWDTAFLKIRIRSGISSLLFKPFIEIRYRGSIFRQYFEKTSRGVRYLNLSPLSGNVLPPAAPERIFLKGHHLDFEHEVTELYLFKNADINKAKILVLSPHPDDAELAAFGLYENRDAYIVTLTAGDFGKQKFKAFYKDRKEHYLFQGKVRMWDSVTVPFWGGIPAEHCVNLGYFDSALSSMFNAPSRPVSSIYLGTTDLKTFRQYNISDLISKDTGESTWNSLVNDLSQILLKVRPSIIVTPSPLNEDHPDHQFTTIALFDALEKANIREGSIYYYTVHDYYASRWPFGPSSSLVSPPPYFEAAPFFEKIYSYHMTKESIIKKLFALNDMHDLRPIFFLQPEQYNNIFLGMWQSLYLQWKSTLFMRKMLRENELFFVSSVERAPALREIFFKNKK